MELFVERNSVAPKTELAVSAASTVAIDGAEVLHVRASQKLRLIFAQLTYRSSVAFTPQKPGIASAMSMCQRVV